MDGGLERSLPVSEEKLIAFSSPCGSMGIKEGGGELEREGIC